MKTYQNHGNNLADIFAFKMNIVSVYDNLHWDSGGFVSEEALGGSVEEAGSNCLKFKSASSCSWNVNIRFVFIHSFNEVNIKYLVYVYDREIFIT